MLERGVLTMNSSTTRTAAARQLSPTAPPSEDIHSTGSEASSDNMLLSNPSYDIIAGDVSQFTTQYYHTVEPPENVLSPKDGEEGSSSDSSGSERSKRSSTSSDEGGGHLQNYRKRERNGSPHLVPRSLPATSAAFEHGVPTSQQQQQQKVSMAVCSAGSGGDGGGGSGSSEGTSVKHWSYEEQFKQLYNLSEEPERKEFLDKLFEYMQKKGSPITRVPIMAKQPLDLYRLFKLVVERGGLVEVIKKKAWRAVAKELNLPASITSAAFTMRSQYVKYLYPYECEIKNLSDPQELQVAIDSHKRDRRQSDTVEFMHTPLTTGGRSTFEHLTPVTNTITATQGLQILNSPTVAIPHGAIPPYSGSFIVAGPGGAQMVTPQISGPPQLVQMTTTPHGIPIMVSALPPGGGVGGVKPDLGQGIISPSMDQDGDDTSSQASSETSDRESSLPPAKRVALDGGGRGSIVTTTRIPSISAATTGFMMSPTRHMVPTSHLTSPLPHVVQMAAHNAHIPVVMPTTTTMATGCFRPPTTSSPMEMHVVNGNMVVKGDDSRLSPLENGLGSPQSAKRTQVISASHLLRMTQQPHTLSPVTTAVIGGGGHHGNKHRTSTSPSSSPTTTDRTHSLSSLSTAATSDKPHVRHNGGGGGIVHSSSHHGTASLKMPFANIAIQSANKDGDGGDSTLLVTLEINDTVFQGVLFAKPHPTSSPSR